MGAKMKAPTPAPQDAIQLANARFFSKYDVTITTAGKYMRPNPIPINKRV